MSYVYDNINDNITILYIYVIIPIVFAHTHITLFLLFNNILPTLRLTLSPTLLAHALFKWKRNEKKPSYIWYLYYTPVTILLDLFLLI